MHSLLTQSVHTTNEPLFHHVQHTNSVPPGAASCWPYFLHLQPSTQAIAQGDASTPVPASKDEQIRAGIERNTKGKIVVRSISSTPINGVYAIETPTEVFYVGLTGGTDLPAPR